MAGRKRSATGRNPAANHKKTSTRKTNRTPTARKHDGSGRVKGERSGPATRTHPQSEPTKRASSRRRTPKTAAKHPGGDKVTGDAREEGA